MPDSLRARVSAVEQAIWGRNEGGQFGEHDYWVLVDVFQDVAIVRQGRGLLSIPYSFDDEGDVVFGDPVAVEAEYNPIAVQEAARPVQLVEAEGSAMGLEYEIEVIHPGLSLNGLFYSPKVLGEAVPLFEGMHVYYFDDDAQGHKPNPLRKTPRQMVGWVDGVKQRADGVIVGSFHFLEGGAADPIREQVLSAWRRGKTDLFGLSIDARGLTKDMIHAGQKVREVTSLGHILSTDIVLHPAAGGRFARLVASATADESKPEERVMSNKTKRLLRILESRRPDALTGIDKEKVEFGELAEVATEDELQEAFKAAEPEPVKAAAQTPVQENNAPTDPSRADITMTRLLVREQLQESHLPVETQARIRQSFDGQVATEEEIQEAIKSERDYLAKINPARVRGLGHSRDGAGVEVGAERIDKLQAGLDRAFGLDPEDSSLKNIKPLGLRELYNEITFGGDPSVNGQLQESSVKQMLQESFDSSTLPRVMANALHRRLAKDYSEVDYGERRIISLVSSASDFRNQESIRIGYFGDIPVVNPETADYAELAAYGEESATYAVGQRGALVTITRRHIINDDIGHVKKVVSRLGRAARRTFAEFVWAFARDNGLIYDGTAWFTAGHANLLAVALDAAGLTAARQALFNQTELNSGAKLGSNPHLLVVPIELEDTAKVLNKSGTANTDNPHRGRFGANDENIIVNPLLTDANDWMVFANPADVDTIEIKFLNGQEEPELFLADSPTVGQMFVADKLQYKIRHEYGGAVTDFRGAVKSVVI